MILIIGGTYFAGRVFSILAAREGYELAFLNRGRYSMKDLPVNVREFKADRRDENALKSLDLRGEFDAIIDFCAYEPGDILSLLHALPIRCKKYIYLSTADVYERKPGIKDETSGRIAQNPSDPGGIYAYKKKLLEDELMKAAESQGFSYTIFRPAFIYGPYNYAPRESMYIRSLIKKEPIYQPVDSTGRFQMVYVKDAANAILAALKNDSSDRQAYNLSAPEVLDYSSFLKVMENAGGIPAENIIPVTVKDVLENQLPLPFPLTEEESELFDGTKVTKELGLVYTKLEAGMANTFSAFRPVYEV